MVKVLSFFFYFEYELNIYVWFILYKLIGDFCLFSIEMVNWWVVFFLNCWYVYKDIFWRVRVCLINGFKSILKFFYRDFVLNFGLYVVSFL